MRSGVCALQQTLTAEAASVLKHSLGLAKRRGHAQVTPLHVAATLLTSRASLLRRACLKSHHHNNQNIHNHHHQPLQCRALELCFNVALNRLPTTGGPLLHSHHQPSLSNALIAALKRAQAHQRRGSIEQQQHHQQAQPLLTIKVELEQLIISILDDPSVSRVMREAGFSSTAVKNNLEEDSSTSINSSVFLSSSSSFLLPNFWHNHLLPYSSDPNPLLFTPPKGEEERNYSKFKDDIMVVFDVFLRKKKKNTVIVGDSVSVTEGLVCELMGRFERGEVPEELRRTHFVKFQFSPISFKFMKREDVERKLLELKRKVDCLVSGGEGVIIYTGDLKWTIVEDHDNQNQRSEVRGLVSSSFYSPSDHLVSEISRLFVSKPKVWIVATASFQTYMKCQMRETPLEIQWALHAVNVPSGGIGLSLHAASATSVHDSRIMFSQSPETKPLLGSKDEILLQDHKLNCCSECASHCEKEAQLLKSGHQKLPAWLQPQCGTQFPQKDELAELRRKWSRLCHSLHQGKHNQIQYFNFPLQTQTNIFQDSNSISFADPASEHSPGLEQGRFERQHSCTIEFNFDGEETGKQQLHHQEIEPSLNSLRSSRQGKEVKISLALGISTYSDSGKVVDRKMERSSWQRTEMCKMLKENVPWQSEIIPSVVEAMIVSESTKEPETCWLLIPGTDSIGKKRLARAVAELVLGSSDLLLQLNNHQTNGKMKPEPDQLVLSMAMKTHKKLVVFVEDIESADSQLMNFLAEGFETGKFGEANCIQAIFILSKRDSSNVHENDNKGSAVIQMTFNVTETTMSAGTGFNTLKFDGKRKAIEWDLPNKEFATKNPRMEKKENQLSRQSSFNTDLDLNVKADDDDGGSDLTREMAAAAGTEFRNPIGFLESIENVFVFNRSPARDREMKELFQSKMEESFSEICGKQNVLLLRTSLSVEERVLEEVCYGSGCFSNCLFEKWVKDVFQTALKTVRFSGKGKDSGSGSGGGGGGGGVVRLCLGGKEEGILEDGYMGSCLPTKIQVSYKD
ncbi:protein SMAX1-LIKE 4-like isoform X2 [Humulus lupulus]|uniref:protein SMAX1-LIKE 4-like isoform X2 n=1 Tax=Humulus lupulus TaxID=3486 RepID=UPI002B40CBB6|nr:protein SMAX1-LIKE 4-like isoform X2 [Humulus lupulus]